VQWKLDDSDVRPVSKAEVLAQHAYLLFYSCHTTREESLVAPLLNVVSSTSRGIQDLDSVCATLLCPRVILPLLKSSVPADRASA
jgi:hypothetical protein